MASAFQKFLFLTKKKSKHPNSPSQSPSPSGQSSSSSFSHSRSQSFQHPILTTSSLNSAASTSRSNSKRSKKNSYYGPLTDSSLADGSSSHSNSRRRASTLGSNGFLNSNSYNEFEAPVFQSEQSSGSQGQVPLSPSQSSVSTSSSQQEDEDEDDDPDLNPIYNLLTSDPKLSKAWEASSLVLLPNLNSLKTLGRQWEGNLEWLGAHCLTEDQVEGVWKGVGNEKVKPNQGKGKVDEDEEQRKLVTEALDQDVRSHTRFTREVGHSDHSKISGKKKEQEAKNWEDLGLKIELSLSNQVEEVRLNIGWSSNNEGNLQGSEKSIRKTLHKTLKVTGEITVYPNPNPTPTSTFDHHSTSKPSSSNQRTQTDLPPQLARRLTIAGFEVLSRASYVREKERKEKTQALEQKERELEKARKLEIEKNRNSAKRRRVRVINVDGLILPLDLEDLEREWRESQINDEDEDEIEGMKPSTSDRIDGVPLSFPTSNSKISNTSEGSRLGFNPSGPPSPSHSIAFPSKALSDEHQIVTSGSESQPSEASNMAVNLQARGREDLGSGFGLPVSGAFPGKGGKNRRNSSPLLTRMKGSLRDGGDGKKEVVQIAVQFPRLLLDLSKLLSFSPSLLLPPNTSSSSVQMSSSDVKSVETLVRSLLGYLMICVDSMRSFVYVTGFEEYSSRKVEEKIYRPCFDWIDAQVKSLLENSQTPSNSEPVSQINPTSLFNLKSNLKPIVKNLASGLMFSKFYSPIKKSVRDGDENLNLILRNYRNGGIGMKELGIEKVWKEKNLAGEESIQDFGTDYFSRPTSNNNRPTSRCSFVDRTPHSEYLGVDSSRRNSAISNCENLEGFKGQDDGEKRLRMAVRMVRGLGVETGSIEEENEIQLELTRFLSDPFGFEKEILELVSSCSLSDERHQFMISKDIHTPQETIETFGNVLTEIGNAFTEKAPSLRLDSSETFSNSRSSSCSASQQTNLNRNFSSASSVDGKKEVRTDLKLSTDDLIPTLAYLIIQSGCSDLVSKLAYIKAFGSEEVENEKRWALTTFDLVVEWLRTDPLAAQLASAATSRQVSGQMTRTTSAGSHLSRSGSQRSGQESPHSHSNPTSQALSQTSTSSINRVRSGNNPSHVRSLSPQSALFIDGNWTSQTDLLVPSSQRPSTSRSSSYARDAASRERRISLPLSNVAFNKSGESLGGVNSYFTPTHAGTDEGHQGSNPNTFKLPGTPASHATRRVSARSTHPRPGSILGSVGEGIASISIDEVSPTSKITGDSSKSGVQIDQREQENSSPLRQGESHPSPTFSSSRESSLRSNRLDHSSGSGGSQSIQFSDSHSRATSLTSNPSSPSSSSSELQIRPQIIMRHRRPVTSSMSFGERAAALERSGSEISNRSLNTHAAPKSRIVGSNSNSNSSSGSNHSWTQSMSRALSDRSPPVSPTNQSSNDSNYSNSSDRLGTITPRSRPNVHPRRKSLDSWTALNMFSSMSIFSNEGSPTSATPQVILPNSSSSSSVLGLAYDSGLARSPSSCTSQDTSRTSPPESLSNKPQINQPLPSNTSPSGSPNLSSPNSSSGWFYSFLGNSSKYPTSGSDSSRPGSVVSLDEHSSSTTMLHLPRSTSNSGSVSGFSSLGSGYQSGNEDANASRSDNGHSSFSSNPTPNSTSFPASVSFHQSRSQSPPTNHRSLSHSNSSSGATSHRRSNSKQIGHPSRLRLLSNSSLAPPKLQKLEASAESTPIPTPSGSVESSPVIRDPKFS